MVVKKAVKMARIMKKPVIGRYRKYELPVRTRAKKKSRFLVKAGEKK